MPAKYVELPVKLPPKGRSLAEVNPALAREWHPTRNGPVLPEHVYAKAGSKAWWKCSECHFEWDATISSRAFGNGCRECRPAKIAASKRRPLAGQSLAEKYPEAVERWHPTLNGSLMPTDVYARSGDHRWWLCACGEAFEATPANFVLSVQKCRGCVNLHISQAKKQVPPPGQSLFDLDPEVASQWHPTENGDLTPRDVTVGSETVVVWLCERGHCWPAPVTRRTSGRGCQQCWLERLAEEGSPRRYVPYPQSLAALFPELLEEWHPTRNGDRKPESTPPSSNIPVWWRCTTCKHEWSVVPKPRTRGSGCSVCFTRLRLATSRDELHLSAELASLLPVDDNAKVVTDRSGKRWSVDIIVPARRLIVEYDGWYWHQNREAHDLRKTVALEEVGWSVLRVREAPLALLGNWSITGFSREYKRTADQVVEALTARGFLDGLAAKAYRESVTLRAPGAADAHLQLMRDARTATRTLP